MTPEREAEIRQRCERATPGKWYVKLGSRQDRRGRKYGCDLWTNIPADRRRKWQEAGKVPLAEIYAPRNPMSVDDPREETEAERLANADFMAHARQDVPDLLDALARARSLADYCPGRAWSDDRRPVTPPSFPSSQEGAAMTTAPTSRDARVRDVLGLWWAEEFPHDVLPTEALVRLSEQLATLDMFDAPDSESSWTKVDSSGTTQSR